jgi:hypothetical protein
VETFDVSYCVRPFEKNWPYGSLDLTIESSSIKDNNISRKYLFPDTRRNDVT